MNPELQTLLKKLKISTETEWDQPDRISSGSLILDYALGGGWPRGRMSMLTGMESYGKSTVCLLAAATATNMEDDGYVAYFDMERTFDYSWAKRLGVNLDRLAVLTPASGEKAQDQMSALLRSKAISLIIFDSIAETAFEAELEGSAGDNHVGIAARKWNAWFRANKGTIAESNTAVIFINQIRMKIGVMHGNPETLFGGMGQNYAASIIAKVFRRPGRIPADTKKEQTGMTFSIRTTKNKTVPARREAEITLITIPGQYGVLYEPELAALGKMLGVLTKEDGSPIAGSCNWFYGEEKLGYGEGQVTTYLIENPDTAHRLEADIRQRMAVADAEAVGGIAEGED